MRRLTFTSLFLSISVLPRLPSNTSSSAALSPLLSSLSPSQIPSIFWTFLCLLQFIFFLLITSLGNACVYLCLIMLTEKAMLFSLGTTCVSSPFGWSDRRAHRKHTVLISGTHTHPHTSRNPPHHGRQMLSRELCLCTSTETHTQNLVMCDLICGE